MLEYAAAVRDRELLGWCKSSYEWAKTQGSSLVGFFPEMIMPDYPSCESCEVADMIGIAAKLSTAGVGDYWDDIDRWARNQFAENQLTEGEWIYRMAESMPKKPVAYQRDSRSSGGAEPGRIRGLGQRAMNGQSGMALCIAVPAIRSVRSTISGRIYCSSENGASCG